MVGMRAPSQGSMLPFQAMGRVGDSTSELAGISMIKQSQSNAHLLHHESNIIVGTTDTQGEAVLMNEQSQHQSQKYLDNATTRQGSRLNVNESRLNRN